MHYLAAANLVALLHFLFILFVIAGAGLVWHKPWLAWVHIPAAAWGVLVISMGWICPLTPLENWLLGEAGQGGYEGGFMEEYLFSVIYPVGLTRGIQVALGLTVLVFNVAIYGALARRKFRSI